MWRDWCRCWRLPMRDGDDPAGAAGAGKLAAELRRLVRAAEQRSGRKIDRASLAQVIHVSPQSLYAYLNGSRLPPAATLDALLVEIGAGSEEIRGLAGLRDEAEEQRHVRAHPEVPVPRGLPAGITGFVGRGAELARLDEALASRADGPGVTVLTISGAAGIGKTT